MPPRPGEGPCADRSHDSTASPPRGSSSGAGSAACRALAGTRPTPVPTPGQRRPPRSSAPSTRSRPPPSGSQSTSSTLSPLRAACTAAAAANTDAPAPPRPPTTASTAPSPPPPSTACASAATSHGSASGSEITCSAPTATACFHASGGGSPETATMTPARRGSPLSAHARAADASSRTTGAAGQLRRASVGSSARTTSHPRRRGRPEHGCRARPHRTPSPARADRPPVPSGPPPARPAVVRAPAPPPRRPARPGPQRQAWGRAGRPDRRVGPLWMARPDVDNWGIRRTAR